MKSKKPWMTHGNHLIDFCGNCIAIFTEIDDLEEVKNLVEHVKDLESKIERIQDTIDVS